MFGVSEPVVRSWRREGCPCLNLGIATHGRGSKPRFNYEEVKAWLQRREERRRQQLNREGVTA